jgi:hypothetical protein
MKNQQNNDAAYQPIQMLCCNLSKRFHILEPSNDLVPTRNALGRHFFLNEFTPAAVLIISKRRTK